MLMFPKVLLYNSVWCFNAYMFALEIYSMTNACLHKKCDNSDLVIEYKESKSRINEYTNRLHKG